MAGGLKMAWAWRGSSRPQCVCTVAPLGGRAGAGICREVCCGRLLLPFPWSGRLGRSLRTVWERLCEEMTRDTQEEVVIDTCGRARVLLGIKEIRAKEILWAGPKVPLASK